jgi:tryptophan halogenase
MKCSYESAVDYVNMHYSYCRRKGKFWDYVRSKYKKSSMQELFEGYIQDPNVRTPQTGKVGSFFDGTNWQVWLLQLMTEKINPKEYWKKDSSVIPRFLNFVNNDLRENQENSVIQSQYISHLDTLE